MRKRWKLLFGLAAVVATTMFACGEKMMWTKVSDSFMQNSKPYGAGDFRVRGNYVVSMKLAEPETPSKPRSEWKDPNRSEPVEAWMDDVSEIANRRSVSFYSGSLNGPLTKQFEERAQDIAWWASHDLRTIYLATTWQDYHLNPEPGQQNVPCTTKLFKSVDGGKHWQRLDWPEIDHIVYQLRFSDPLHGYAIGQGPHVWRTQDGGETWTEIMPPPFVHDADNERKRFDWIDLSDSNVLRVAYFVDNGPFDKSSVVFTLKSHESTFQLELVIPQQSVVDMIAIANHVYLLTAKGLPADYNVPGDYERSLNRPNVVLAWDGETLQEIKDFPSDVDAGALYRTPSKALLVDATRGDELFPNDVVFITRDGGKTWTEEDEGNGAQGVYYDQETGLRWRVNSYSLYRRQIP